MTPKIKHSLLAIAAILILCGCENNYDRVKQANESGSLGGLYYIDTLSIHGKEHEIIRECTSHRGGIMHSPECWCGKGDGR